MNIKVAVRQRPLNKREINLDNCEGFMELKDN